MTNTQWLVRCVDKEPKWPRWVSISSYSPQTGWVIIEVIVWDSLGDLLPGISDETRQSLLDGNDLYVNVNWEIQK